MASIHVKTRGGTINLQLNDETRMCDLKNQLSKMTDIDVRQMKILMGFPPKPLNCTNDNASISSIISRNETLIVEECSSRITARRSAARTVIDIREPQVVYSSSEGPVLRFIMPANNSCLFTSINFVVGNGRADVSQSSHLRGIIAERVAADTENYNEAFLGKSNKEYCDWIQDEEHWGGAIEISILCEYFGVEIAVIDRQSKCVHRFGQNSGFDKRVFLIYNGSHYDAVALRSRDNPQMIETVFPVKNHYLLATAKELSELPFTENKSNCIYVCNACSHRFKCQPEMVEHAIHTEHYYFSEG